MLLKFKGIWSFSTDADIYSIKMYVHLVLYTMTNNNINVKLISCELIRTFLRVMPTFHSVLALILQISVCMQIKFKKDNNYSFIENLR